MISFDSELKVLYYDFVATNILVYRRNEGSKFSFRDMAKSNIALYFATEGVLNMNCSTSTLIWRVSQSLGSTETMRKE